MTINFELKGLFNQHSLVKNDESNVANDDNHSVYSQIISGTQDSEMLAYLMNMNHQRLNDFKSMLFFNETNQAALRNEAEFLDEVTDFENVVFLPQKIQKLKESLESVLKHRKSTRRFSQHIISLKDFSTILKYSFGVAPRKETYSDIETTTRFYASGGGLYPVKMYIYCNNVEGVERGFYLYQPISHSLLPVNLNSDMNLSDMFPGGSFDVEKAIFLTFFGYRVNSTYLKYGELSLLTTLVETGIISHNFDLVITALGYSGCAIAGYNKSYVEHLLDFDHVNEHILFSNICGKE